MGTIWDDMNKERHSRANADAGLKIQQTCGMFVPVGYAYPGILISFPCQLTEDHEQPHRIEIQTDEWYIVIEGTKHAR